jgi:hypothetical protein
VERKNERQDKENLRKGRKKSIKREERERKKGNKRETV